MAAFSFLAVIANTLAAASVFLFGFVLAANWLAVITLAQLAAASCQLASSDSNCHGSCVLLLRFFYSKDQLNTFITCDQKATFVLNPFSCIDNR